MNIRRAVASDVETVMDLTKRLAVYEREGAIFNVNKEFFLENILCEEPKAECYLIENDKGDVVGMGELFVTLSTYTASYKLNLQDFYILPEFRGQGFGKAFMKFLAEEARKRNCVRVFWGVYDWNELARGLYEKVGKPHHDTVIYSMGPDEIQEMLKA